MLFIHQRLISMPKKTKFTKKKVIEAGLLQLREGGWESLTPKSIARRLDSSTMPIFSHFQNMPALKEAVLDRAWELLVDYTSQEYTGDIWVDQSVGYIIFARDNNRLFSCMHYGTPEEIQVRREKFWISISQPLENYRLFEGMTAEQIGWVRHIRSLLTHGIAISVSSGISTLWNNDQLIEQTLLICSEVLAEGLSKREDQLNALSKLIPEKATKKISVLKKK